MRLRYFALLILAVVLLAGCEQNAPQKTAAPSVAVVDFNRLVLESAAGKQGTTHLEAAAADMQKKLMGMQNSEDMAQMQVAFAMYQEAVNALQEKVVATFTEAVKATTNEVRAAKGIDCVLHSEAAIALAPAADITDAVIAELNKKQIAYPTPDFDLSALEQPAQPDGQQAPAPQGDQPAQPEAPQSAPAPQAPAQ